MFWQILIAVVLGILAGTITGLVPGLHVNRASNRAVGGSMSGRFPTAVEWKHCDGFCCHCNKKETDNAELDCSVRLIFERKWLPQCQREPAKKRRFNEEKVVRLRTRRSPAHGLGSGRQTGRLHTRCPLTEEQCRRIWPELKEIRPGYRVACHLVAG